MGAATGNVEEEFELRNRSKAACWVYGYVGLQVLDAKGRSLPLPLTRSTESFFGTSDPPTQILLPPGTAALASGQGTGHAFFNIATSDGMCNPGEWEAPGSIRIWPPDEYASLVIPARLPEGRQFGACGGMSVNPLHLQPRMASG